MDRSDGRDWQNESSVPCRPIWRVRQARSLGGSGGIFGCLFVRLLFALTLRDPLFISGLPSSLNPQVNRHDRKARRHSHRTGQIRPNAHESIRLHEQIEEETLVQMLKQVVQTPADTLNCSAKRHLVLPSLTDSSQGYCVDMIGHENAVRAGGMANRLT